MHKISCLVLMSRATASYPKWLQCVAVCISVYCSVCSLHILLICLVHVVDEAHLLSVQMWTCLVSVQVPFGFFGREK